MAVPLLLCDLILARPCRRGGASGRRTGGSLASLIASSNIICCNLLGNAKLVIVSLSSVDGHVARWLVCGLSPGCVYRVQLLSWTDWSVQLQGPGEQAQPRSGTGGCGTCTLKLQRRETLLLIPTQNSFQTRWSYSDTVPTPVRQLQHERVYTLFLCVFQENRAYIDSNSV